MNDKPEWMAEGACVDHEHLEWWFPVGRDAAWQVLQAQRVCAGCPVRPQCLEHALVTGENHGVWGGATPRELRRIRRQRAIVKLKLGTAS